ADSRAARAEDTDQAEQGRAAVLDTGAVVDTAVVLDTQVALEPAVAAAGMDPTVDPDTAVVPAESELAAGQFDSDPEVDLVAPAGWVADWVVGSDRQEPQAVPAPAATRDHWGGGSPCSDRDLRFDPLYRSPVEMRKR